MPVSIKAYNAGAFPYAYHQGKIWFLLGQEPHKNQTWDDFGGKSDPEDRNDTRKTAAREFAEETKGIFGDQKKIYPKLDESQGFGDRNQYRTYLVKVDYVDAQKIRNVPRTADTEKLDYMWVPAEDFINFIAQVKDPKKADYTYNKKKIRIFHRYVWILQNFNKDIREAIRLGREPAPQEEEGWIPSEGRPRKEPESIEPEIAEAYDYKIRGQTIKVESVSVLPYAYHEGKILFLLGGEVGGQLNQLMYSAFGTTVNQSAFIRGSFDPLIIAGYGFRQTTRDIYEPQSEEYIKNAIRKTGKIAFYD